MLNGPVNGGSVREPDLDSRDSVARLSERVVAEAKPLETPPCESTLGRRHAGAVLERALM